MIRILLHISEADLGLLQHPRMEHFVITVNGWKPLTIITKSSILDVAAALDPPLYIKNTIQFFIIFLKLIIIIKQS